MPELERGNLVIYKNRPALIKESGAKKITLTTENGKISVRPKDVILLHNGRLDSLADLNVPAGDIETAWELLAGSATTLEELSDLAYGDYTPHTAVAIWELLADGRLFHGDVGQIIVRTAAEVAEIDAARDAKAAQAAAWDNFVERVQKGEVDSADGRFLQELAMFATGQQNQSRLLKALRQAETVENAHALLLKLNHWDEGVNPHPLRLGINISRPQALIPPMPQEVRRDLTHLPALAIDDEGSSDPDDAISWDNGRVWIHVADVAALISPDSAADLEARERGANLYLPEGTITMLPAEATTILGLGLQEVSPALSFGLKLNHAAELEEIEITPSWIKVTRTSYEKAEKQLEESPFKELVEITNRYAARRAAFGAVKIDLPEVRIRVKDGSVVIRPLPNLGSRNLVRDAMLMAGEAAARFAFNHTIPIPYTTQDAPSDELPPPDSMANMFARRRMMSPSQAGSQPGAHFGLGMGLYAQVTSPLRRYLDLVVHQQVRAFLLQQPLMDSTAVMERVGAADAVSREVRFAERQSNKHWTLVFLAQNPDWTGEAVVVEKRGKRDIILIPDLALDVPIRAKDDRPLNSHLMVKVKHINLPRLEVKFEIMAEI